MKAQDLSLNQSRQPMPGVRLGFQWDALDPPRMAHGYIHLALKLPHPVWTVAPPGMADTLLNVRHQLASKESVSEVS
jgi:hypothetical protein